MGKLEKKIAQAYRREYRAKLDEQFNLLKEVVKKRPGYFALPARLIAIAILSLFSPRAAWGATISTIIKERAIAKL